MISVSVTRLGSPDRPPLLLGPSLGTSSVVLWGAVGEALADEFQVLAWDLPGHGASPPATAGYTMAELADAVLASVADAGPFYYAGDSIGGAVGLQLLLDHPDRVRAATLMCTGARIGTAEAWTERAALVREKGVAALLDSTPGRWFAPGFPDRHPGPANALLDSLRAVDGASYAFACEALAGFDVRHRLAEITTPVLALAGGHDVPTPVAGLREIADGVRDGRLVVLDEVAHLAPAETPARVACLVAAHSRPPDRHAAGMRVRREVLGDAHVDRANAGIDGLTRDFQDFITRYAWGEIWTRPGLDRRSRSMITITAMVARGHHEELAMHLRAARTNGVTVEEIKEVLLQAAVYCGVPDANTAFRIAQQVFGSD
ncbi:3-oxoadipate enol-lactonase [Pseudonocardia eucalypti]|uniref:3-oxoadipate enol-lactonase n=1 Tax=Pseudonocardia eucalypti TaxID=648755 RepID=A0ABP9R3E8_9PSEU|nr:3-oxoadipate enol-lactonase/4-carboxymuconolactone decarboxylase [Pseudonocardia eucalypti]